MRQTEVPCVSLDLSSCAWTPTPAASRMHPLVSSPRALAFPVGTPGRRCAISPTATSVGAFFSGLQSFTNVQAHKFARLSGSSHPCISCWAAEAFTFAPITVGCLPRAANMLTVQNRAIDGEGTSTLLDQQLCRLLRSHRTWRADFPHHALQTMLHSTANCFSRV